MAADDRGSSEQLLEQAEEMIWNLLDDNLPEGDIRLLETMIQQHDQVRELYLDCVQLHTELSEHYGKSPKLELPGSSGTPVLGSWGDVNLTPGIDTGPPVAD